MIGGLSPWLSHCMSLMPPKPPVPLTPKPIPDPVFSFVEVVPKTECAPCFVVGVSLAGDSKIRAFGLIPVSWTEFEDDERFVWKPSCSRADDDLLL